MIFTTYDIFYADGKFKVVEKSSENIVGIFDKKEDAYAIIKKFRKNGFAGWTPKFFLNPHFGERPQFLKKIQSV